MSSLSYPRFISSLILSFLVLISFYFFFVSESSVSKTSSLWVGIVRSHSSTNISKPTNTPILNRSLKNRNSTNPNATAVNRSASPPPRPLSTRFDSCPTLIRKLTAELNMETKSSVRSPKVSCQSSTSLQYISQSKKRWDQRYTAGGIVNYESDIKSMYQSVGNVMKVQKSTCPQSAIALANELVNRKNVKFRFDAVQWEKEHTEETNYGAIHVVFSDERGKYDENTTKGVVDVLMALRPDPDDPYLYPQNVTTTTTTTTTTTSDGSEAEEVQPVIDMIFAGYIRRPQYFDAWPITRKHLVDAIRPRHIHVIQTGIEVDVDNGQRLTTQSRLITPGELFMYANSTVIPAFGSFTTWLIFNYLQLGDLLNIQMRPWIWPSWIPRVMALSMVQQMRMMSSYPDYVIITRNDLYVWSPLKITHFPKSRDKRIRLQSEPLYGTAITGFRQIVYNDVTINLHVGVTNTIQSLHSPFHGDYLLFMNFNTTAAFFDRGAQQMFECVKLSKHLRMIEALLADLIPPLTRKFDFHLMIYRGESFAQLQEIPWEQRFQFPKRLTPYTYACGAFNWKTDPKPICPYYLANSMVRNTKDGEREFFKKVYRSAEFGEYLLP